jgi:hypothetical protein
MRETRTSGSVEGVLSNGHPYSDSHCHRHLTAAKHVRFVRYDCALQPILDSCQSAAASLQGLAPCRDSARSSKPCAAFPARLTEAPDARGRSRAAPILALRCSLAFVDRFELLIGSDGAARLRQRLAVSRDRERQLEDLLTVFLFRHVERTRAGLRDGDR